MVLFLRMFHPLNKTKNPQKKNKWSPNVAVNRDSNFKIALICIKLILISFETSE